MAENDQYPHRNGSNFAPVGIILVVAVAVILAIFVYARSQRGDAPATVAPPPAAAPATR